jgi:pimeloyl-ACP methyl ester carboxylesterase
MRSLVVSLLVLATACSDSAPPPRSGSGEVRMTQIDTGTYVFDARVSGPDDGELVVLLHGFPETSYEWRHQLQALGEAGYRVVAPNQRGYSAQARPLAEDDYAVPLLVNDVRDMVDALGVDRFHIVGHDWGAGVAWGAGVLLPDRLITLTAMSVPHPDAFNEQLSDMTSCQYAASSYFETLTTPGVEDVLLGNDAAVLRGLYTDLPEDAIDEYVSVLEAPKAMTAALNWYRANIDGRRLSGPAVGAIGVPTLFIWSDGDDAICREGAEGTAAFVSGDYQFEVLQGINHWIPELAADAVSSLLLAHIAP